ncbi:MAG: hypothetical protein IJK96_02075 [Bacteroidales bacterium]|nr:hypothetical protein [Bacteroidales bacterium]
MIAIILSLLLQVAQTPEEMYQEYTTPETRAILEQFDQLTENIRESEKAERTNKTIALIFSLAVGLIPLGYLGRQAVKEKTWKDNPEGTVKGLVVGLLGGAVLFGLNYGIFLLKLRMGDDFNTVFAFALVAAMIIGAIYLLKK